MTIPSNIPLQPRSGGRNAPGQRYAAQSAASSAPQQSPVQSSNQPMPVAQMWHVKLLMDTGAALAATANSQQSWDAFVQYAQSNGLDDDGHLPAVFDPRVALHYAQLGMTVSDQLSAQLRQMLKMQGPAGAALGAFAPEMEAPLTTGAATGLYQGGRALANTNDPPLDGIPVGTFFAADAVRRAAGGGYSTPASQEPSRKGQLWWVANGVNKLQAHVAGDPSSGLTPEDVHALQGTSQGQQLLMNANDVTPGSMAMRSVAAQAAAMTER